MTTLNKKYDKTKCVVVFMAMNIRMDLLKNSLKSFYKNYNDKFKHDVIIFHDDKFRFSEREQVEIKKNRSEIQFHLLDGLKWAPPNVASLVDSEPSSWAAPGLPLGYINMMRWCGILVYEYLTELGYEWYMRVDDDFQFRSRVDYDLFEYMHNEGYEYGFRSYCSDVHVTTNDLVGFCRTHIEEHDIDSKFSLRFVKDKNLKSTDWRVCGYCNSFLISSLEFWMREDVQKFLQEVDETGNQYLKGWSDLMVHTMTIHIFMDNMGVYRFVDWEYVVTEADGQNKQETVQFELKDVRKNMGAVKHNIIFGLIESVDVKSPKQTNIVYCGEYDTLDVMYDGIRDYYATCDALSHSSRKRPIAFVWHTPHYGKPRFGGMLYAIIDYDVVEKITMCKDVYTFYPINNET